MVKWYHEDDGAYYSIVELQGRRENMEDTSCVYKGKSGKNKFPVLFGVFDGHGGEECSMFCKNQVCKRISKHPLYESNPPRAMSEVFEEVDKEYCKKSLQMGYDDGSTASVLYLKPDEVAGNIKYYCAVAGDSRCILVYDNGDVLELIEDHDPFRESERIRVEQAGGQVIEDWDAGIYRVYTPEGGKLAVTRAIGDALFKPAVTGKPEIADGSCANDVKYIILASDGIWVEFEKNEEAGKFLIDHGLKKGIRKLAEEAYERGSHDNITICAVDMQKANEALMSEKLRINNKVHTPIPQMTPSVIASHDKRASYKRVSKELPELLKTPRSSMDGRNSVVEVPILKDSKKAPHLPPIKEQNVIHDLLLWRNPTQTGVVFGIGFLFLTLVGLGLYTVIALLVLLGLSNLGIDMLLKNADKLLIQTNLVGDDFDASKLMEKKNVIMRQTRSSVTGSMSSVSTSGVATFKSVTSDASPKQLGAVVTFLLLLVVLPISLNTYAIIAFVLLFTLPLAYSKNREKFDKLVTILKEKTH